MDAVTSQVSFINQRYDPIDEMDLKICKFFTIISKFKKIQENCNKQQLNFWINKKIEGMQNNLTTGSKCKDFILQYFKIEQQDEKKYHIASQYAPLIVDARPDNKGILENVNYVDLVYLVKKVFKKHIAEDKKIFSEGIILSSSSKEYYSIISNSRVYIFSYKDATVLGKGMHGLVNRVYNLFVGEFLAFKVPYVHESSWNLFNREIKNLQEIHEQGNTSIKGIQDMPLAVLSACKLKGYLMPVSDCDLKAWIRQPHSNQERILVCQEVMQILKNVNALKFWHGDIKPQNILKTAKNHSILIDWAGGCLFRDAIDKAEYPKTMTNGYICPKDIDDLKIARCNSKSQQYVDMIQTLELFAVAITLFQILVPEVEWPFSSLEVNEELFLNTKIGMKEEACDALSNRKYSEEIIQTIKKMLSHDSKDRYNLGDAVAIWENIAKNSIQTVEK